MSRFTLELARAVRAHPALDATISISRQNELYAEIDEVAFDLFPIDTFRASRGALLEAWRIPGLRRRLCERLRSGRVQAVIELLPHVWSPLVAPAIAASGVRYVPVIHDADLHPGDPTAWTMAFANRCVRHADVVVTLSQAVADRLVEQGRVPASKVVTLFLPDLHYGPVADRLPPRPGEPLRLAFFGRIMPYKGLPLFVDVVERLRAAGIDVQAGVFGEGALGACKRRLQQLGAEVVNRWLSEEEIGRLLPRYHAMVLSHVEASQSGVVAAAFGMGLPVVATPVGGLGEQIVDGSTGVLAERVDAAAIADAITRLLDPHIYTRICRTIAATRGERSMPRFVEDCSRYALPDQDGDSLPGGRMVCAERSAAQHLAG